MAQVEFKKIANIRQKDKDIVNGFIKEVQTLFPEDNPYYIIADLIKHLCLLYFHHKINSKLLTDEEQTIFMKLLRDNNKFGFDEYEWKLIYRASNDGLDENIAKEKYEGEKNLVALIHTENDNIFGGYTSVGWRHATTESGLYDKDEKAFCFSIRSSKGHKAVIRNVIKSRHHEAMFSRSGYYLIWNGKIYLNGSKNTADLYNYGEYEACKSEYDFTGGLRIQQAKIKDIEVFQLL